MKQKLYKVDLTYDEIVKFLPHNPDEINEEARKTVGTAIRENRIDLPEAWMKEEILKAIHNGKLTWMHQQLGFCRSCDAKMDYALFQSGPRRGRKNYDKPRYVQGYEINAGFVVMKGLGGICQKCFPERIKMVVDYINEKKLPVMIQMRGYENNMIKDDLRICYKCDAEIYESEMKKRPTMFGDGYYPAGCPKCEAEALPFGQSHKSTNKFRIIEVMK